MNNYESYSTASRKSGISKGVVFLMCLVMLTSGWIAGMITAGIQHDNTPEAAAVSNTPALEETPQVNVSEVSGFLPTETPAQSVEPPDNEPYTPPADSQLPLGAVNSTGETLTLPELFEGADPAVVAISTETTGRNIFGQTVTLPAAGSGFIISEDGYIVTNNHVIDGANTITVIMNDGNKHSATLVAADSVTDLAVLKIDAKKLSYLTFGDSNAVRVGELAVAIGNPLGEFANSLTVGYISALNRVINIDGIPRNMLQTDAAVNSGNSGGPLLNAKGQVIGVVSAKSTGSNVEGLGFAIASNFAADIVEQLLKQGFVSGRAAIGAELSTRTDYRRYYVCIETVTTGGAADKAGIRAGDIILSADGVSISSTDALRALILARSPGDTVTLEIRRNNERLTFELILGELIPNNALESETRKAA